MKLGMFIYNWSIECMKVKREFEAFKFFDTTVSDLVGNVILIFI